MTRKSGDDGSKGMFRNTHQDGTTSNEDVHNPGAIWWGVAWRACERSILPFGVGLLLKSIVGAEGGFGYSSVGPVLAQFS